MRRENASAMFFGLNVKREDDVKSVFCAFALLISAQAYAVYDSNRTGVVTHVVTYPSGAIFLTLENQPQTHPLCQTDYFVIDSSVPESARSQMLARLLVAYSQEAVVTIGYDGQGDCAHGRIRVHRVG